MSLEQPEEILHNAADHSGPFFEAYTYRTDRSARRAYFRVEDAIRDSEYYLSVLRFSLGRVPHVAILGEEPPETVVQRLRAILKQGSRTELPPHIIQTLWERRLAAMQQGSWVEGHYRPGFKVDP